jgi:hypothetical protein
MTTGTLAESLTDWQAGVPCEKHDLGFCTDCRDSAKITRRRDGSLGFKSDCVVQTIMEAVGATYAEALEMATAAGYVPGKGTPADRLPAIFEAAGFKVRASGFGIEGAVTASAAGRVFVVSAHKGRTGHAWSITGGNANRAYQPPFRYTLYEIEA